MTYQMPQHRLPSYGRRDIPEARVPFTVSSGPPRPQQQPAEPPPEPSPAAKVFDALTAVNTALAEHRAASHDPRLTERAQRDKLAEFADGEHAKVLPVCAQAVDGLVAEKQAAYDDAVKNLVPEWDTAGELRAGRCWQRERAKLEALSSEGERVTAARTAIEKCDDRATLAVLVEELPAFLEAKGVDTSTWFPEVIAAKAPEVGAAKRALHNASQQATTLRQAARMLEAGIASGTPVVALDRLRPAIARYEQR